MTTLYWAVYPAGQADPPASQIIAGTVPNGVFSTDTAPTVDDTVTGAQITGLTAATDYKLACVWDDGVDTSIVAITPLWTTTGAVDVIINGLAGTGSGVGQIGSVTVTGSPPVEEYWNIYVGVDQLDKLAIGGIELSQAYLGGVELKVQ